MITLCAVSDIPDSGAVGFDLASNPDRDGRPIRIIVTRLGDRVFAWQNLCPHAWVSLDTDPGRFMDYTGQFLQCSYHGAIFTLGSGVCLRGPCKGQKLLSFPITLSEGLIKINAQS